MISKHNDRLTAKRIRLIKRHTRNNIAVLPEPPLLRLHALVPELPDLVVLWPNGHELRIILELDPADDCSIAAAEANESPELNGVYRNAVVVVDADDRELPAG